MYSIFIVVDNYLGAQVIFFANLKSRRVVDVCSPEAMQGFDFSLLVLAHDIDAIIASVADNEWISHLVVAKLSIINIVNINVDAARISRIFTRLWKLFTGPRLFNFFQLRWSMCSLRCLIVRTLHN